MQIDNSVAIVTGAASGLGLATTRELLTAGARVVMVDLATSPGAEVAAELGEAATFVAADVTSQEQVGAAVSAATGLGSLRILVNCAGMGIPAKTVGREGPALLAGFITTVTVNLIGTFNVIRLAAAAMAVAEAVDGERGVIVNTASVAAFEGQVGQAAYSASKGGIVGMTLPVARDLAGYLIRVCTIAPGIFETPLLGGLPDHVKTSLGQQVPHPGRLGRPSEYADLVRHIVENPMLNGETIRLDGAIRMAPR
ncbi:SDR family NAD(P)-dependent oxidoreductase [Nocardioides carbamazepini]|uniref:SDR family NAD(P)-dependent oxidoreductase n=1 Tax=Nocardioides carbamazepini TaxID=2854259 RepID=UPI00214A1B4F|nr:SDR family NAD(P)-dependent oxidoreductase [Nocardioides carbamazepini]MCR1786328.1 SDR family NAD(P)-dependent oxidoreductase [Nocardioides carbamazepini]